MMLDRKIAKNQKLPVTLDDFGGNWVVWSVMPFDSATPLHALPVQFGDKIKIATSEPGYEVPGELNECDSAAAVLNLTRNNLTPDMPGSDISVLQYLKNSAELSGTLIHDYGGEVDEFVFNIKHIGEITKQIIESARVRCNGDDEMLKKFEKQVSDLEKISKTTRFNRRLAVEPDGLRVNDLSLIWTNRFKHPGGIAHVHESD